MCKPFNKSNSDISSVDLTSGIKRQTAFDIQAFLQKAQYQPQKYHSYLWDTEVQFLPQ